MYLDVYTHNAEEKPAALYIALPPELAQPIDGGCQCDACQADPSRALWDTLLVPLNGGNAYTVHWPRIAAEGVRHTGPLPQPRHYLPERV